jgi:soluble lytic murein transglycosylase-like protein
MRLAQASETPADLQREAMEKQRAAARKQAESVGARLIPWSAPIVQAGPQFEEVSAQCDPLAESVTAPLIESAAKAQGLEPKLIRAVIEQESAFRPCAVSNHGAQGLMQLMPGTAQMLNVADPFDPKQNIDGGTKYLKQMLDLNGGDLTKALGAYNAGPNADDPANKIPESINYVDSILSKLGLTRADQPKIQMPKPIGN